MKTPNPPPGNSRRLRWSGWLIAALFVTAAVSQAKLQTAERARTISLAEGLKRYEVVQPDYAVRGTIVTRDGKALAKDEDSYDLNVDFRKCPDSPAFWLDLSQATGLPATEFSSLAEAKVSSRTWPQSVTLGEKAAIDAVRRTWRADGVSAVRTGRRAYPLGASASCFVGIIRKGGMVVTKDDPRWPRYVERYGEPADGSPIVRDLVTGLEAGLQDQLAGHDGMQRGLTDRAGNFLPMRTSGSAVPRVDGATVTLTIDSELQSVATEAIRDTVEKNKAESGVAIVMDPHTGDLLAMANWPSFEPYNPDGTTASMDGQFGSDPAYMSCLEPGSMFKVLTLAKALDSGVVHMSDHTYCAGEWQMMKRGKPIRCDLHHGTRAMGDLDVVKAIAKSCNIAAAKWAVAIQRDPFVQFIEDLGLLRKTRLGLPGETRALFNRNDPSPLLQLATMGFGQSINCTPVALAGAFGTLGNDGVRVEPRLLKAINGREIAPDRGVKLLGALACDDVLRAMTAVFETGGTGATLKIPGYRLAGKTGTAQKLGRTQSGHVSNFVGFVPADRPQAVILVMVNKPQNGSVYGATVAGPAFVQLAHAVIRKNHIEPEVPAELSQFAGARP